jgi:hypothetical protein
MDSQYEVHVSGLEPYIVPIAFPDSIVVRTGDVVVVVGTFDLDELGHRVDLLGGAVLAVFRADESRSSGPPSPLA